MVSWVSSSLLQMLALAIWRIMFWFSMIAMLPLGGGLFVNERAVLFMLSSHDMRVLLSSLFEFFRIRVDKILVRLLPPGNLCILILVGRWYFLCSCLFAPPSV